MSRAERVHRRINIRLGRLEPGEVLKAVRKEEVIYRSMKKVKVMSEWETLRKVLDGMSLARYGDGEVKHIEGKRNVSQVFVSSLQERLIEVFNSKLKNLIVAIPNVFNGRSFTEVDGKFIHNMKRRFGRICDPGKTYGSSYLTRGDLCGYLSWPCFWGLFQNLWDGRDVVLVRGHEGRANPSMIRKARNVDHVATPFSNAWKAYPDILKECKTHPKESVYLLCVGPTATVLAHDLCKSGRWAVDIGHRGMFYRRIGIEDDRYRQEWRHRPTDPGYIRGVTDRDDYVLEEALLC
jgi:hypothetical protein